MNLYKISYGIANGLSSEDERIDWQLHIPYNLLGQIQETVSNTTTFSKQEVYESIESLCNSQPAHICGKAPDWVSVFDDECEFSKKLHSHQTCSYPYLTITIGDTTRRVEIRNPKQNNPILGYEQGRHVTRRRRDGSEHSYWEWTNLKSEWLNSDNPAKEATVAIERWIIEFADEAGLGSTDDKYDYIDIATEFNRVTSLNHIEAQVQALVESDAPDSDIRTELSLSRDKLDTIHDQISRKYSESMRLLEHTTPRKPVQSIPLSANARDLSISIEDMNNMDYREFERFVGRIWEGDGYDISQTKDGADGGIDLIASNQHETIAIQVKQRSTSKISQPTVRKVFGALHGTQFKHADRAIVVTTGDFTGPAREFADLNDAIQLVDGDNLGAIISLDD